MPIQIIKDVVLLTRRDRNKMQRGQPLVLTFKVPVTSVEVGFVDRSQVTSNHLDVPRKAVRKGKRTNLDHAPRKKDAYRCKRCGATFDSIRALGGHVSGKHIKGILKGGNRQKLLANLAKARAAQKQRRAQSA